MTPLESVAVFTAGIAAGGINAVVGAGTLITFPTLLAVGYPPVLANVTNNVGLVPGFLSGAFGYRRELSGQRGRLTRLGAASVLGALAGGALLLALPAQAFRAIVPALILLACALVAVQPWLNRWITTWRDDRHRHGGPWLWAGVCGAGMYGGYFGAAQGVLLLGLLGSFLDDDMQRVNAAKNVLVGLVNGAAAVLFVAVTTVEWLAVLLIAVGSSVGGLLGAHIGRRLPPVVLRVVVIAIGVIAAGNLIFG